MIKQGLGDMDLVVVIEGEIFFLSGCFLWGVDSGEGKRAGRKGLRRYPFCALLVFVGF